MINMRISMNRHLLYKFSMIITAIFMIIFWILVFYNIQYHLVEEKAIDNFIKKEIAQNATPVINKSSAFQVSDVLRSHFNTNRHTWKYFNLKNRPFFRNSVLELLNIREGVCGEGTRVLVRVLQKMGYDATRVSIYMRDRIFDAHTLISVVIDGKEYFIDSVNSSDEINKLLKTNDIASGCFNFRFYDHRFDLEENKTTQSVKSGCDYLVNSFSSYSYEAIPFNKILSVFNIKLLVRNFNRPGFIISYIAESYFLLNTLFFFFPALVLTILFMLIYRKFWALRQINS